MRTPPVPAAAEAALETVQLAELFQERGVVGVDLSGNPTLGHFDTWIPALQRARDGGLKLSLHCAEVDNPAEVREMLAFRPERLVRAPPPPWRRPAWRVCTALSARMRRGCAAPLPQGHAVTAAMDDTLRAELLDSRIPVELCLTSNVLSQSTPSFGRAPAQTCLDAQATHAAAVCCAPVSWSDETVSASAVSGSTILATWRRLRTP